MYLDKNEQFPYGITFPLCLALGSLADLQSGLFSFKMFLVSLFIIFFFEKKNENFSGGQTVYIFYLAIGFFLLCALTMLPIPIVTRRRANDEKPEEVPLN